MPKFSDGIGDQGRRAIDLYFENGMKKGRAMKDAGYAHPYQYATEFFKKPAVQAEIKRRREALMKKHEVTTDRIIQEFAAIAFNRVGDLLVDEGGGVYSMDFTLLTDDQRAALTEFQVEEFFEQSEKGSKEVEGIRKTKVKFSSKQAALDSLARIFGMYDDKISVTGELSLVQRLQKGRQRVSAQ